MRPADVPCRYVFTAFVLATLAGAACAFAATAADAHPFTVRDLVRLERLSEPRPSPDGRQVVFTRRVYDWDSNAVTTNLWLVGIDGKGLRALTTAASRDNGARWSPDGRTIAFLSNRGGTQQIW